MNELSNDNKTTRSKVIAEIIDWAKHIIIALIAALLLLNFVVLNATIPTESMHPTIEVNNRIFANRLAYLFSEPKRGDIIVFKAPDEENILYVKRVIGLPGETVEIKNTKVYINGNPIEEPYISVTMTGTYGPYKVPEGKYFMMGDNRNNSKDSRLWQNKYLDKNKIQGKAVLKYYPGFKLF